MKKVVIGMSGGVDSSVAAYLLKKQGYEVIGIMLKQVPDDEEYGDDYGGCCSLSATEDARRVANKLDIPFYVWNFKKIFEERVIEGFIDDYCSGKTPNPCVQCNKKVRFSEFLRKARMIGADYLATGHYARVEEVAGRFLLKKPVDERKDQTYMLYTLNQDALEHIIMPNAEYTKDEIRAIADEIGLEVSNKKDSFEICFIPDDDHGKFIRRKAPDRVKEGDFILKDGTVVGKHKGISNYTIGQRKGLGLALGRPVFVIDIDSKKNAVILGDNEDLFKTELTAKECNFISFESLTEDLKVTAKIRYAAKPVESKIYPLEGNRVKVVFEQAVRAVTPGQSVVFYDGDIVVGGGIIE